MMGSEYRCQVDILRDSPWEVNPLHLPVIFGLNFGTKVRKIKKIFNNRKEETDAD
jgi:hypothetical protein